MIAYFKRTIFRWKEEGTKKNFRKNTFPIENICSRCFHWAANRKITFRNKKWRARVLVRCIGCVHCIERIREKRWRKKNTREWNGSIKNASAKDDLMMERTEGRRYLSIFIKHIIYEIECHISAKRIKCGCLDAKRIRNTQGTTFLIYFFFQSRGFISY